MAEQLLFAAATPFESARKVTLLPEGHRSRRLHGHSFLAKVRVAIPPGWAGFPGGEVDQLRDRLTQCIAPLDYKLLNDEMEQPTDEPATRLSLPVANRGEDGATGTASTGPTPIEAPTVAPPIATPTPRPEPKDGTRAPLILAGIAGLMLLVLLGGGAWWFWLRPVDPPPAAPPAAPPPGPIAQIPPTVPPPVTPPAPVQTPAPTPDPGPIPATPPAPGPAAPTWPDGTDSLTLRDLVERAPNPAGIHAAALRRQAEGRHDDAYVLFEEAAARGHAAAMTAIGRMYDPNGFVPGRPFSSPDPRSAARFYRDAARAGDPAVGAPRAALRETLDAQAQRGNSSATSALQEFWP